MENSIRKMLSGKQLDGFPVPRFDPEKKTEKEGVLMYLRLKPCVSSKRNEKKNVSG